MHRKTIRGTGHASLKKRDLRTTLVDVVSWHHLETHDLRTTPGDVVIWHHLETYDLRTKLGDGGNL